MVQWGQRVVVAAPKPVNLNPEPIYAFGSTMFWSSFSMWPIFSCLVLR